MRAHLLLATALFASTSCKPDASPPAAAAPAPTNGAATPTQPPTMQPSQDISAIAARLAWEAQHRPALEMTAERVFDALERDGVSVLGKRQYLGVTMRASYCAGGVTRDDVAISVCEYPSREAAEAGKGFMERQFARMTPFAKRIVHGPMLLSIAYVSRDASTDVVRHAVETFTRL